MNLDLKSRFARFHHDEDGSTTISGILFFLFSAIIVGLAVDQANGWRVRTQLQIAADAAALAGAANIGDRQVAENLALQTAALNLGSSDIITKADLSFGHIDAGSSSFVAGANADGAFDAVQVNGHRISARSNALPTTLMRLIGIDTMDIRVRSIAAGQVGVNGGGFAGCEDAAFLSTKTVQTGGSNELHGAICIHGERGVATGGDDLYNPEVRMSAVELDDIYLASYAPADLPESHIKVARSMSPVLLPQLNDWQDQVFADLWKSRGSHPELWEQPDAPWGGKHWYYVGQYELSASDYDGIIPSFVFDSSGMTTVYMRDTYWSIQPGELEEHSIYLSNQGIAFSGGVDIENVAVVSEQDIGGGGGDLFFDDVFFLGNNLNFPGNVKWGEPINPCDHYDYGVYAFGTQSLSLGGWTNSSFVNGMVGAAPRFEPGGAMTGTGVYFESDSHLNLGGNMNLFGCGTARSSEYTLVDMSVETAGGISGSYLYH